MGIGKEIEKGLIEKKMSIKELSEKANVPYNTLYACIKRDSDSLRLDYLLDVLKVLDPDNEDVKKMYSENYKDIKDAVKVVERLNSKKDEEHKIFMEELIAQLNKLNYSGRHEALRRIEEMTLLEKYTK